MKSKFINCIFMSLGVCIYGQNSTGSQCSVQNSQGVCKLLHECPSLVDDIKNDKPYVRCGNEGENVIVCCIEGAPPTEAPPIEGPSSTPKLILENEFPHMALVGFDAGDAEPKWLCGGTLISEEYVLTAGHCLNTKFYGNPKYVRIGACRVNSTDPRVKNYNISAIIPHPEFKPPSRYNDIALLKLHRKVEFNSYINRACLPTFDQFKPTAIATGWGLTKFNGETSNDLRKVTLDLFSMRECVAAYKDKIDRKLKFGILAETQFCAGSRLEAKDTCDGDSGGPLVTLGGPGCKYTVIGVTSFGVRCGTIGVPGVYTKVYFYVDWIEGVLSQNSTVPNFV